MNWIWVDSSGYDQSRSVMIVLGWWKRSKSMDWISWKAWKSARIHLLGRRGVIVTMRQNHFVSYTANHWNPFKLVNTASVILEEILDWTICHNCSPSKLAASMRIRLIFVTVHLRSTVLYNHEVLFCRSSLSEKYRIRELYIPTSFSHNDQKYSIFVNQVIDRSSFIAVHHAWARSSWWKRQ